MKKTKSKQEAEIKKGFDLVHKEQTPEIPKEVIHPPKEATDPAETIKHA